MIEVGIVDGSAQDRIELHNSLEGALKEIRARGELIGQISWRQMTMTEAERLHFNVLLVGEALLRKEITTLARLRAELACSIIVVTRTVVSIAESASFVRLGADDVISLTSSPVELIQRILIAARRSEMKVNGQLIITDGAKGGVGTTTLTASLGQALFEAGKRAVLIDTDTETQMLSRSLEAIPYINEAFTHLLRNKGFLLQDNLKEYVVQITEGDADSERGIWVIPPPQDEELMNDIEAAPALLSAIEFLQRCYDYVIIDSSDIRKGLMSALLERCDTFVFTFTQDPSSLFAAQQRISRLAPSLSAKSSVALVANRTSRDAKELSEFFSIISMNLRGRKAFHLSVPESKHGENWVASGESLYSRGNAYYSKGIDSIVSSLGIVRPTQKSALGTLTNLSKRFRAKVVSKQPRTLELDWAQPLLPDPNQSIAPQLIKESLEQHGGEESDTIHIETKWS